MDDTFLILCCILAITGSSLAGLSDNCTSMADCSTINNATCGSDKMCECVHGYVVNDDKCILEGAASPPGLGDTCVNHTDCYDVDHAECIRDRCTCSTGYRKYGIVCITVLNSPCVSQLECSGHLPYSTCETNCVCETNFTVENSFCKRGHGKGGCKTQSDCVSNALCNDNKVCMCKSSYTAANDICVDSGSDATFTSTKLMTDIVLITIILGFIIRLF